MPAVLIEDVLDHCAFDRFLYDTGHVIILIYYICNTYVPNPFERRRAGTPLNRVRFAFVCSETNGIISTFDLISWRIVVNENLNVARLARELKTKPMTRFSVRRFKKTYTDSLCRKKKHTGWKSVNGKTRVGSLTRSNDTAYWFVFCHFITSYYRLSMTRVQPTKTFQKTYFFKFFSSVWKRLFFTSHR